MSAKANTGLIVGGLVGLAALAGLAGMAGGGKTAPKGRPGAFADPKLGGINAKPKPAKPKPSDQTKPKPLKTGLRVGVGCSVTILDLAQARSVAFSLGKRGPSLDVARGQLFGFGDCGVKSPLKPIRAVMRDLYLVEYELWRGAVAGGYLDETTGHNFVRAAQIQLAINGLKTSDLPTAL